jgi:hypothetical protein
MAAKKKFDGGAARANTRSKAKNKSSNKGIDKSDMAKTIAYEVSGAGDAMRFIRNPSFKNAAMLGVTVAAYAAGPAAKAAQAARVANTMRAVNATADARAASAAARAATTNRVVRATGGAGTITTRGGTALPMTGIRTFSTAKNPVRAAASTRVAVANEAQAAGMGAAASMQRLVTGGKVAGASVASAKAGSTVSTQKQKNKKRNVR